MIKKLKIFLRKEKLPIGLKYCTLYTTNILKIKNLCRECFNNDFNKYIKKNDPKNFINTEILQHNEYLGIGLCTYDFEIKDLKYIFDRLFKFWQKIFNYSIILF